MLALLRLFRDLRAPAGAAIAAVAVPGCGAPRAEAPLHGIGVSHEVAPAPASRPENEAAAPPSATARVPPGDASVPDYVALASQGRVVPPGVEDVENACALLASCPSLPWPPEELPRSLPACVRSMTSELASPGAVNFSLLVRECAMHARSCDEVRTCALRGASPDACVGHGRDGRIGWCDGSGRAISCFRDKVVGVRDCPRDGEGCVQDGDHAVCALGRKTQCDEGDAENAENAEKGIPKRGPATWCSASGNRAVQCDHESLRSEDCNVSVGCMHGHQVRVDCGAGGLACKATPGSVAVGACVAAPRGNGRCKASEAPRCDGATIKYCFAGKERRYSCKGVGFERCVKEGSEVRCGG